ncbi:hypothetical protein HJD18_13420 [Thermoleophilia bacterium SCSIO 60948]|nr:hypothetical protein HJD18_13420 [Thermoleophilia bacterium SCSIO 60948]
MTSRARWARVVTTYELVQPTLGVVLNRKLASVLAAIALVACVGEASAAEGTKTRLGIRTNPVPAGFEGEAKSSKPSCIRGRQVLLMRKRRGPDEVVGTDRTDVEGHWSAFADSAVAGETFYAKTAAKRVRSGRCLSARSREIAIDEAPTPP